MDTKNTNNSKLEVLAQMGKNAIDYIKNIRKGYASEQLASTFNIPGIRFAKKHLNADYNAIGPGNGDGVGQIIGMAQDCLCVSAGVICLGYLGNNESVPLYFMIPGLITSAKLITNPISYTCSRLSDAYKSAIKSLENKKAEGLKNKEQILKRVLSKPIGEDESITDKEINGLFHGDYVRKQPNKIN